MGTVPASIFPMTNAKQRALFEGIDDIPELAGSGVVAIDDGAAEILRPSSHLSGLKTYVVIEVVGDRSSAGSGASPSHWHKQKIVPELVGAGLEVPSTILAGSIAAEAGMLFAAVTEATIVVAAGAVLASFQLGVKIGRVINEVIDPSANARLDSIEWWRTTTEVLDVVGLLMDLKGLPENLGKVTKWRRITGKPLTEFFKPLSRQERKQFARELAREVEKAQSNKQFKALVRAGKIPSILPAQQINRELQKALLETVNSALDVGKSSRDGVIRHYLIHLGQEGA